MKEFCSISRKKDYMNTQGLLGRSFFPCQDTSAPNGMMKMCNERRCSVSQARKSPICTLKVRLCWTARSSRVKTHQLSRHHTLPMSRSVLPSFHFFFPSSQKEGSACCQYTAPHISEENWSIDWLLIFSSVQCHTLTSQAVGRTRGTIQLQHGSFSSLWWLMYACLPLWLYCICSWKSWKYSGVFRKYG